MTYQISIHLHGEKTPANVAINRRSGDANVSPPIERVDATIKLEDADDVRSLISRAVNMLNLSVPPPAVTVHTAN